MKFAQREREGGQNSGPALASVLSASWRIVLNFCFVQAKRKGIKAQNLILNLNLSIISKTSDFT
ncbi:MAG: hypothetical protein ACQETL_15785 [Bacteroidota bacterium]